MPRKGDPPLRAPGKTIVLPHTQYANFPLLLDYHIFCLILYDFSLSTFSTSLGFPLSTFHYPATGALFRYPKFSPTPPFLSSLLSTFSTADSSWNLNLFFPTLHPKVFEAQNVYGSHLK